MPPSRSTSTYRNPGWFLALPALLVVLLLVWAARRADPRHQAPRRLLLVVLPSSEPGALEPARQQALALLVRDALEMNGDLAVTQSPTLPASEDRLPDREGWVLAFTGFQRGLDLELRAWAGPMESLPVVPELPKAVPGPPAEAVAGLLARLSTVSLKEDRPGILIPRSPEAFWPLLKGLTMMDQPGRAEEALALAATSEVGAPRCATPAILRGQVQGFLAVERARPSFEALNRAREAYEEALNRAPDHPRASYLLARLLADTGRMKEALARARQLSRAHPHTYPNYQSLAYVGRNAGLLGLVEAAAHGAQDITLDKRFPPRLQIGLLYLGRWDEFEASLWLRSGESYDAVILFHMGYLELLRGQREQALAHFRRLRSLGEAYPRYRKLGEIFRFILEGNPGEARKRLGELDQELDGLRGADGEFSFNLAEAYALLGDRESALDLASRSLAQGFACTRWYEQSPLMAPLKGSPRWEALLQTLRERQARLEGLYPVSDFPS